ncbi:putative leader peptide [Streptomyces sp. ADI96-15]|uniref:putative leader peptide n=1 Tax=Streptomyces sp. ADI96-15 TaxID=1522761 RepID=UPI003217BC01
MRHRHVGRSSDHRRRACGPRPRQALDTRLTMVRPHGLLRNVTDTETRLWRRVHMDLVRYAGCVCRPGC